jgi:hypothetical protein
VSFRCAGTTMSARAPKAHTLRKNLLNHSLQNLLSQAGRSAAASGAGNSSTGPSKATHTDIQHLVSAISTRLLDFMIPGAYTLSRNFA